MPARTSPYPVKGAALALSVAALFGLIGASAGLNKKAPNASEARARLAAMPLVFEQNIGQAGGEVQFLARGQGYTLGLNGSETLLSLQAPEDSPQRAQRAAEEAQRNTQGELEAKSAGLSGKQSPFQLSATPLWPSASSAVENSGKHSLLKMRLVGANPKAKAVGEKRLKAKINYFIGNDPKQWKTDVPAFEAVRTKDVYPGIDLVHYGQATGALEYDLVVAPGVDPGQIRLQFDGAESIRLADNGDLLIRTEAGEVRQQKPVCYQVRNGQRMTVEGEFMYVDANSGVGLDLSHYDQSVPLTIDPVVSYSTYIGGAGFDEPKETAIDSSGCLSGIGE